MPVPWIGLQVRFLGTPYPLAVVNFYCVKGRHRYAVI